MIPSAHADGYFPFANRRLKSLIKSGDIISYECLKSSALKQSKPQLFSVFLTTANPSIQDRFHIQSTLVISTSVISNNRLSRRKNLVLVITQKSKSRL